MNTWYKDVVLSRLEKIYCGGKIPQVVLGRSFEVEAVSEDHSVVVDYDGLPQEQLPHEIGVMDLNLLIRALGRCGEEVYIYIDDYRLVLESRDGNWTGRLVLGAPEQITTKVPEGVMGSVKELFSDEEEFSVPVSTLHQVVRTQGIFSSETLVLSVSPEGASFRVGSGSENIGEVSVPEIAPDSEYELHLPADTFSNVVSAFHDDSEIIVKLSGPESMIEFSEGAMRYGISPVAEN